MKRFIMTRIKTYGNIKCDSTCTTSEGLAAFFEAGFLPTEVLPPVNRGERLRDGVGDLPGFRLTCKSSPYHYDVYPLN